MVRPSCVWQALFDIRNARQEHGVVLVAGVGAKNVFVPVVQGWAVLHDVGGCLQFCWEGPRSQAANLSGKIIGEHALGDVDKNVGRVEDDMIIKQGVRGRQQADKPQISRPAHIAAGHMAKLRLLRAERAQPDEMAFGTAMHMNARPLWSAASDR